MLYKFKSRATADLILLDAAGKRLLKIVGKEPAAQGIITAAQIPAAIAALEAAVAHEESTAQVDAAEHKAAAAGHRQDHQDQRADQDDQDDMDEANQNRVTLRQRAAPFIDMLKRSAAEGMDVVWGV